MRVRTALLMLQFSTATCGFSFNQQESDDVLSYLEYDTVLYSKTMKCLRSKEIHKLTMVNTWNMN